MVRGCVYLPEKLAKVELHLRRPNSFEFVALFLLDLNRNSSEMPYEMDRRKSKTNEFNKGRPDHQQREDSSETQP